MVILYVERTSSDKMPSCFRFVALNYNKKPLMKNSLEENPQIVS